MDDERREPMGKFEKGQVMNKLCHALLREAAEAGFSVADVSEIPDRLRNIIEMSIIIDDRVFDEAIKKV